MITGSADDLDACRRQLPERVWHCLREVLQKNPAALPDGTYGLMEGKMTVKTRRTAPAMERKLRGHRRCIDVILLLEGEEWIGTAPRHDFGMPEEACEEEDIFFFEGWAEETNVYMKPGHFAVFFPEDLHRPKCSGPAGSRKIRRVTVKLPVAK